MRSNLTRGILAERKARHLLLAKGYTVIRSAASRGYDLIAINADEVILVSVKSSRTGRLPPQSARNLRRAPAPATVKKQLWSFQPYHGWRVEYIC